MVPIKGERNMGNKYSNVEYQNALFGEITDVSHALQPAVVQSVEEVIVHLKLLLLNERMAATNPNNRLKKVEAVSIWLYVNQVCATSCGYHVKRSRRARIESMRRTRESNVATIIKALAADTCRVLADGLSP